MSDDTKKDILKEIYNSEIPYLAVGNGAHIELYSNKKLSLDGNFSVLEYSDNCIILKLKKNCLQIVGTGLNISSVSEALIVICGEILSLEFINRE